MKRLLLAIFTLGLLLSSLSTLATHIVGAELYYTCLGTSGDTSTYELELKLYRDCLNGQAPYDGLIYLFIFDDETGDIVRTIPISVPPVTPEIVPDWNNCLATAPSICVEEGIYETTIQLKNDRAYHLGWSRCCRNAAITNLVNPLNEGITFLARVPPASDAVCNSMPQFDEVPPIFLCANEPFFFDHSATDPDGDSLVYALTNPYTGINNQGIGTGNPQFGGQQPVVDPVSNLMGPPPYQTVSFLPGYSFDDPFGSGNFQIDAQTGYINVTPNQVGIFVFSVSVFEYRNGVLLSENRRDFQIHVLPCLPPGNPPTISHDLAGLNTVGDTIFVEGGESFCYDVAVNDVDPGTVLDAFTVSAAFGNGSLFFPPANFTFSGTNPINGQVCWTPACEYAGQTVPLVVGGEDVNLCDNFGKVLDTVWVKITVPPNQMPTITPDLSGLQTNGDTIIVEAGENLCVDYDITDPNAPDVISAVPLSNIFNDPNNPATFTSSGTNPVSAQVCWPATCDFEGQLIELALAATDSSLCKTGDSAFNTLWVRVIAPPNADPTISTDLSGVQSSNDTIIVAAEESFCFSFTGVDPDVGDVLTPLLNDPLFSAPNGPTVSLSGNNPLQADICWTPGCQFEGQTVRLVYGVEDPGSCSDIGQAFDTVYVRIEVPNNDPPQVSFDLSGNTFSNDTIFVFADDGLCFDFTGTDPNQTDVLNEVLVSGIFNQANGPTVTATPGNPLQGQICWTPSCQSVGQTVELVFGVEDNASCSAQAQAVDTVYVQIQLPPNDPPTAATDLSGLTTVNDTIVVDVDEALCYTTTFSDLNAQDTLTPMVVSSLFSASDGPIVQFSGVNPLTAQVCWTPNCNYEGDLVELILGGIDNGECNNSLEVFDTVYIRIREPVTLPPIVESNLAGNQNVSGDTITIQIDSSACYSFYIADQTRDTGLDFDFDFEDIFGNALPITQFTTQIRNDSVFGQVCFQSSCANGGTLYRSIVTGIDLKECPPFKTASDTVYLRVVTTFRSFAGMDTSLCAGSGGVELSAVPIGGVGPYYFTWRCDDPGNCGFTNSNQNDSTPVVNPNQTTTYSVQITDFNGCTSEIDDIEVTVKALPIADAGPDRVICGDDPGVRLQASVRNPQAAPGPYTYQWQPATGLSNPNVVDPFARPSQTTIYTLVIGSANGCTSDATTLDTLSTVTVAVNPTPQVEAGDEVDICLGDTATLQGFGTGAGPDYRYIWTPSRNMSDSSAQVTRVSPTETTTYYLVAWSGGCPSPADSVTVRVRTLPTVTADGGAEVCAGDSVRLEAQASGDPSTSQYTYRWSPAVGLSDPTVANPLAGPLTTTTYQVVATSDNGCDSEPFEVEVDVKPTPVAEAGTDTTICGEELYQLPGSYSVLGGPLDAPLFVSWTPSGQVSPDNVLNPTARLSGTTRFYLTTRAGACATTDSVDVAYIPGIEVAIEADTNRICSGDTLALRAVGGRGSARFAWQPGGALSDTVGAEVLAFPATPTDFVVVAEEGQCIARDTFELWAHPTPEGDYQVIPTEGCAPLEVSFAHETRYAIAFIWDFGDGSPISNEPFPTHTYRHPGAYPVTLTAVGLGGCSYTFTQDTVRVNPPGQARFTLLGFSEGQPLLREQSFTLDNLSQGAERYLWSFGDGGFSEEFKPTYAYAEAGSYLVELTITDEGGCTDTYQLRVEVEDPDVMIPNVFTPNGDGANDTYIVRYTGLEDFELRILDRWGRLMYQSQQPNAPGWSGIAPDGGEAGEGTYYYLVRIGQRSFKGHLTLLR
mgnify:CR=1 FL=1